MQKLITEYKWLLNSKVGANTVEELLIALGYFLGFYIAFKIFRKIILTRLKIITAKTPGKFDDELVKVLEHIHPRFYDLAALYCAVKTIHLTALEHKYIDLAFIAIFIIQLTLSIQELLGYLLSKLLKVNRNSSEEQTAFNGIYILVKITVWASSLLLVLSTLGINASSLVTSLGIGGIAIALAVQNILGDIFSSFSIYFDKPFAIGDQIVIGGDAGYVRKIGLKTTRLEMLSGEELIVANRELTNSRIQNFKKMQRRQVLFSLRIAAETNTEQLKLIPELVTEIISKYEISKQVKLERVFFKQITSTHLDYEILYYHLSNDFNEYMRVREEINLQILETLSKNQIKLYFSTAPLPSEV